MVHFFKKDKQKSFIGLIKFGEEEEEGLFGRFVVTLAERRRYWQLLTLAGRIDVGVVKLFLEEILIAKNWEIKNKVYDV